MVTKEKYSILFLTDNLDPYVDFINIQEEETTFIKSSLDKLDSLDTSKLIKERSKFIIVADKSFSKGETHDKVVHFALTKLKINIPFFLLLSTTPLARDEIKNIERDLHFHYLLPAPDRMDQVVFSYNFSVFIKLVFKELLHIVRLNSYIVDSFENIIDTQVIRQQKEQIEKLNEELDRISRIDPLTELLNRRAFYAELEKLENQNYSSLLIDIDFFKKVNDTYGHQAGDDVLRDVGRILNSGEVFSETDIIARYGGEEFIIVLPDSDVIRARKCADTLREQIKKIDFYDERKQIFNVTLSIGIAQFEPEVDIDADTHFARTDKALYYAKQNGRDRAVFYNDFFS